MKHRVAKDQIILFTAVSSDDGSSWLGSPWFPVRDIGKFELDILSLRSSTLKHALRVIKCMQLCFGVELSQMWECVAITTAQVAYELRISQFDSCKKV